jgi:thioredoxin reductase (NADPH)
MADPIVFVVDDDPETLASLAAALQRRFGPDYRILTDGSPISALARLEQSCQQCEDVALVIADVWTSERSGIEWLPRVRQLYPRTPRCLLVSVGDVPAYPLVRRALVLGQVTTYLLKPWDNPEERLYPVVSELLGTWSRLTRGRGALLRIVGERWAARCHELRDLLERNAVPHVFCAHDSDEGRGLLQAAKHTGPLPLVIFHDGRCLADPTNADIAHMVGARTEPEHGDYDLVIIGAGPSGLAAAVYAASEGLRTLIVERQAIGGQAGMSSMIRNYPGFPRGISGADLAARAAEQAGSLGAESVYTDATNLAVAGADRIVTLGEATEVRARTVVVATGVSYNLLEVDGVGDLLGKGVFYGSASAEAPALSGQTVFVVGGGNSAGQAAVHLARYAAGVTMLVRGPSLTMSHYLVKQIGRASNIRIRLNTNLVRAEGGVRLEALEVKETGGATTERLVGSAMFVLIGAGPHTSWLAKLVQRDPDGYILTGRHVVLAGDGHPAWPFDREPHPLETSLPGLFAAGDVRHRSPRGVAAAVADGAIAIRSVREYLSGEREAPARRRRAVAPLRR